MYVFTKIIYTSAFNLLHISQCHIRESISRLAGIFLGMGLNCFMRKLGVIKVILELFWFHF